MATYVEQAVSKSKREEEDQKWYKDSIEYYIQRAQFTNDIRRELHHLYDAYNGHLIDSQYQYITNPYNSDKYNKRRFPARIRNYNIIKPVIDLLIGEKSKRPFNYQAFVKDQDTLDKFNAEFKEELQANIKQMIANQMAQQGQQTQLPPAPAKSPADVLKEHKKKWKDKRAQWAQQTLDAVWTENDLDDLYMKAMHDWAVAGEVITYKEPLYKSLDFDVVLPTDIDYDRSDTSDYIEDGQWVVRRSRMLMSEVINRFGDVLTKEQIQALETPNRTGGGFFFLPFDDHGQSDNRRQDYRVYVYHVVWKAPKKFIRRTYIDPMTGDQHTEVMDEDYEQDPDFDIAVEEFWGNSVFEGFCIKDKAIDDLYLGMQELPYVRRTKENYSKCKLPYNGRRYSDRNSANVSIASLGMPYQILYNIYHYRFELTMAKNKDKIMLMEINAIPKKHGWDEEKFMYFADAMGYAFIDSTTQTPSGDKISHFNQFQVLDMSLARYIESILNILQAIKMEWEELVGITRQRKGMTTPSEGVGAAERAIFQSSVITEEFFRKFEKIQQSDLEGAIDLAKAAWPEGRKGMYIGRDGIPDFIDVDGAEFSEASYGLFVTSSARENEKLQQLREHGKFYMQNNGFFDLLSEVIDSNNFSHIKSLIREAEERRREMEQQDPRVTAEQIKAQEAEKQRQWESNENALDRENKLTIELAKIEAQILGQDMNANSVDDSKDIERSALDRLDSLKDERLRNRELNLKNKEINQKERDSQRKASTEKYKADKQLEIAKENKNKYDV